MEESLIKKRLAFNLGKTAVSLDVSQSLFSSFDIDRGTRALLNSLRKNSSLNPARVLDLGCGYGVMGIFLKKQHPASTMHLVDRDMLAVSFSRHNAKLNGIEVECYPSLDYRAVKEPFCLILCNFPAKMERQGLELFVYGASHHLERGGILAVVVVTELREDVEHVIDHAAITTLYQEHKKGHSIYHLTFSGDIAVPDSGYARSSLELRLAQSYHMITARGLPEFDSLSYGTEALIELLPTLPRPSSALIFEPGQGHTAVAVADLLRPEHILLCSRDLMALQFAELNCEAAGIKCSATAVPFLEQPPKFRGSLTA